MKGYFAIKDKTLQRIELFISTQLAVDFFKLSPKTIQNGLRRNRVGASTHYTHNTYADGVYLSYSHIPVYSKLRHGLPLTDSEAYAVLTKEENLKEEIFKDERSKISYENMAKVFRERWPWYVKYYKDKFSDKKKVKLYARTHGIIDYIIEEEKQGETLKNLFTHYCKISCEEIPNSNAFTFVTTNYYSFLRKIRDAKEYSIETTLIHRSLGRKRPDQAKLTEDDRKFIKQLKAKQNGYTFRSIQEILIEERGIFVSKETIKGVVTSDREIKNLIGEFSKGPSYARKNFRPTVKRIFKYPGDQYQGDGSRLQFVCIDHSGKIIYLTYYVVLDACSGKVVGLSVDRSENSEMIINAFKMAFMDRGYLPKEIVVDNGSAYESKLMKSFIKKLQGFGVAWSFCPKDYPLGKAEIESFFSVFQKVVCNRFPFYVGEGIKTKNTYGNPSEEMIRKYWKNKKQLPTIDKLKLELFNMIKKYNNEYYKEIIEPINALHRKTEEEYDSVGALHDIEAILEKEVVNS